MDKGISLILDQQRGTMSAPPGVQSELDATRARIRALQAQLGASHGVDAGDGSSGPFHHDPRQAGQFVPGLAVASAGDPDIPKTLPRGITDESLQGGGPTPRRSISFSSPANTTLDRGESQNDGTLSSQLTPEYPDNQEGLYGTGTPPELASFLETPAETGPAAAPALKEPQSEVAPDRNQVPGNSGSAASSDPPPEGEGKKVILEGTMYEDGTYWKMDRYMQKVKKGKVQASPEMVKLWGTTAGREKLRELLHKYDDMNTVNLNIERELSEESKEETLGGWKTESQLLLTPGWDKSMVDCAKAWAEKNGLTRKKPVHGRDEYRVPTEFNFAHANRDISRTKASARTTVEGARGLLVGCSADLTSDRTIMRGANGSNAGLHMAAAAVPETKGKKNKQLTFPVLQVAGDPYSSLQQYVEIAGKKVDQAEDLKEKLSNVVTERSKALTTELMAKLGAFQKKFDELLVEQANAMQMEHEPSQQQKTHLRKVLCDLTKEDVHLNQVVTRCRAVKPKSKAKPKSEKPEKPTKKRVRHLRNARTQKPRKSQMKTRKTRTMSKRMMKQMRLMKKHR